MSRTQKYVDVHVCIQTAQLLALVNSFMTNESPMNRVTDGGLMRFNLSRERTNKWCWMQSSESDAEGAQYSQWPRLVKL
jgi:hypothetical protein